MEEFWNNGYKIVKNFFDPKLIESIRIEAKYIFSEQMFKLHLINNKDDILDDNIFEQAIKNLFDYDYNTFLSCGKQCQHLISLHRLSLDEKLIELIKSLGLEKPIISTRPVLFTNSRQIAKNSVNHTVPPHQDWSSMQGSINSVIVWVPLMDMYKEIGPIDIIHGSHKNGLLTNKKENSFGIIDNLEYDKFVSVDGLKSGDIVVFSSFLIHKSGDNISNNIRWSCHFRYNDLNDNSFIERGYPHAYIYKPIDDIIHPDFDTKNAIKKYITI